MRRLLDDRLEYFPTFQIIRCRINPIVYVYAIKLRATIGHNKTDILAAFPAYYVEEFLDLVVCPLGLGAQLAVVNADLLRLAVVFLRKIGIDTLKVTLDDILIAMHGTIIVLSIIIGSYASVKPFRKIRIQVTVRVK